jgi:hypothetical protein
VKAKVADAIGVSPSGLSHLLSRKVNPTGEHTLAILQLTKRKQNMNPNQLPISDSEGMETINSSCLARYAKNKHATILNV